jgi:hypothetical protein
MIQAPVSADLGGRSWREMVPAMGLFVTKSFCSLQKVEKRKIYNISNITEIRSHQASDLYPFKY